MTKMFKKIAGLLGKRQKSQEELRQEYETKKYDHYMAFGNAFVNFCSGK